jgi:prepilin peptidase CpaA
MNLAMANFLGICMAMATVKDFMTGKIPNLLSFPMMVFGIIYHSVISGWGGLGFSLGGMFMGIMFFLIPYAMGGMGAGDAKLMGGVGAFLGFKGVLIAAFLAVLFGLVYAIILLAIYPDFARDMFSRWGNIIKIFFLTGRFIFIPPEKNQKQPVLRFALPIALGTIFYAYLKITDSTLIQDLLGIQFSI